ncbi:MAG: c-type cytochrome domain-containing protein [Syntrophobacteraceae bacterium]
MRVLLSVVFVLFLTILIVPEASAQQAKPGSATAYSEVAPIFQNMCSKCHSGERPAYGLRTDSHKGVMAGGKHGAVVVPGNPKQSELVKKVKGESKPRMPKNGPPWVSEKDTATIEKWIADGARE